MAFVCIESAFFVSEFNCFFQKSRRTFAEKCTRKFILLPITILPYLFKAGLINIADNYAAAKPAKNIAERVDVNTLGWKQRHFAVGQRKFIGGLCCEEVT